MEAGRCYRHPPAEMMETDSSLLAFGTRLKCHFLLVVSQPPQPGAPTLLRFTCSIPCVHHLLIMMIHAY